MHRDIEEKIYEHCLQANALEGPMQEKSSDGTMVLVTNENMGLCLYILLREREREICMC